MNHVRTRRRILTVILCAAALLGSSLYANAAKIQVRVLVTKANIRLEANTNSTIITSVPRGAVLEADEKQGNWYRVYLPPNAEGVVVSGYIHGNLVEPLTVSPVEPKRETIQEKAPQKVTAIPTPPPIARARGTTGPIRGYGVKFGFNLANWYGRDADRDLQTKTGMITGAFVTINIYRLLGFQPEILYTQKGARFDSLGYTATLFTDYIEIPLLLKGSPPPLIAGISPIFYIGPAIAVNIRGQGVVKWGGEKDKADIEDLKTVDIGLVYGFGIHYQPSAQGALGKMKLILDFRYTLGITTISDITNTIVKNGALSVLFGVGF
jgi:hypothetical protein